MCKDNVRRNFHPKSVFCFPKTWLSVPGESPGRSPMRRRALMSVMSKPSTIFTFLVAFAAAAPLSALSAVSPADAPRATAGLLQTLSRGDEEIPVIVGIDDGTPSDSAITTVHGKAALDRKWIPIRLQAQQMLSDSMPPEQFAPTQFYENFSVVAGQASRQGARALTRRP